MSNGESRMSVEPNKPEVNGIDLSRPIVLIGMMGAGKSAIGRMIAQKLKIPFVDADHEIELAADLSVEEIFANHGEQHFRDGECRVIERLLETSPCILATGGGAYIQGKTRDVIQRSGISVWMNGDFEVLWDRVSRRSHRPLLKTADPQGTLKQLMLERYPIYEKADITVMSEDITKEAMRDRIIDAIIDFQGAEQ